MQNFNSKKTLSILVNDINSTFILDEIENAINNFDSVRIFTFSNKHTFSHPKLTFHYLNFNNYKTTNTIFSNFHHLLFFILKELFSCSAYFKQPKIFFKNTSEFIRAFYLAKQIEQYIISNDTYFSFWFDQWATSLAVLKYKKKIDRAYTRAHGTDLYEERVPLIKKIAFRKFQLKYIDNVFSVSDNGNKYIQNKYPNYASKIKTNYLGTQVHDYINPINESVFTIVSCAYIRNIKRIYLLAEVLKEVNFPIKWIHIGGGDKNDSMASQLRKAVSELNNKANIEVQFKGNLTHQQIFSFYQTIPCDVFISVSEYEGLPISMMEAISFGIPILSTNVGGCSEIVTDKTGKLLKVNFTKNEFVLELEFFKSPIFKTKQKRTEIKTFWKNTFNSKKNYEKLIYEINGNY